MRILGIKGLGIVLCFLMMFVSVQGQNVVYFENFESGPQTRIDKIKRYPIRPEIVTSDPIFPGAFPPPSGRYAVRAQDKAKNYFGLGSVVGGPSIDLNNPSQQNVAIEAKIYLVPSPSTDTNNFSLIAVDDFERTEKYYRFGYTNSAICFSYFSGVDFTEYIYDPEIVDNMQIPGWHTLTMRFSGPDTIYCYVDGKETLFSPIRQNDVTRLRMGILGWDRNDFRPIIGDDFKVTMYSGPPSGQASAGTPGMMQPSRPAATPSNPFNVAPKAAPQVQWYDNPNAAVQQARLTGKKFLVLFYLPNHPKTQQVQQNIINNPMAQQTLSKFVPLMMNAKQYTEDCKRYNVFKYPTMKIIDMQGRVYWEYRGAVDPDTLNRSLAYFK